MQFLATSEYTYWWPIKIKRPSSELSGKWVEETFEMKFAAVDQDQADTLAKEIREIKDEEERAAREHDQLLNAARDWRGVLDADKQQVPFSKDMLTAMLRAAPWYRLGIYQSYARSLIPEEARKGN